MSGTTERSGRVQQELTRAARAWDDRVEQELTCAVRARDITARRSHLELAILHLEAGCNEHDAPRARDRLSTAFFARMAFRVQDA